MKLTALQTKVLENLENVVSDGSRHEPQFRLGERNVTAQVRSLLNYGLVEVRGASLVAIEPSVPAPASLNTSAAVNAMRAFLSEGGKP